MQKLSVSVKILPFTVWDNDLSVFLKNKKSNLLLLSHDFKGGVKLDTIVKETFEKETDVSLEHCYIEQLYTFSYKNKKQLDIIYYLLVPRFRIKDKTINAWVRINSLSNACTDKEIIDYAAQRVRWKIEYTNVVYSLLPSEFTLSQLQKTYEAILGKLLDKRNFRKKILSLGILKSSGKTITGIQARPAQIYEFKDRKMVMVKVF